MIVDKSVVPGGGAFQVACAAHLQSEQFKKTVKGKAKSGVAAFADALLIIPKTLAANSGHDIQDACTLSSSFTLMIVANFCAVAALQDEHTEGNIVGLNLATGEPMDPTQEGVYDSFRVLRNCIASATGIASNLLLCDEMLKARQMVIPRSPINTFPPANALSRDDNQNPGKANKQAHGRTEKAEVRSH